MISYFKLYKNNLIWIAYLKNSPPKNIKLRIKHSRGVNLTVLDKAKSVEFFNYLLFRYS